MKKLFVFAIALVILIMIFISPWKIEVKANDSLRINERKYFTNYVVEKDDTLWDIAERYITSEYDSVSSYIKEVMKSNHLEHTEIKQGQMLILPYYADEPIQEL